ncbi:MAG: DNA repair protein RecN, partial [Thiohalophilus sp.]
MLTHIHIWNFAIVEKLDLAVDSGLTVFTGETGAGKSILLDALSLALGDRADSAVIRHGAEKAEISVTFSTGDAPEAEAWLAERELDSEHECIIRRTISSTGPSKAFINGKPTPIQSLRELGEMLVDLHGQHEHQSLLKRDIQCQLLDDYAGHQTLLQQLRDCYQRWQEHKNQLDALQKASSERDARLELLRFQVNELEALALGEEEPAELDQEHKRLANASQLLETSERVSQMLQDNDDTNAAQLLGQCANELQQLAETDEQLRSVAELLDSALIQVREAGSELRHYLDGLELDPGRLSWVEQRLSDLHALARKHHVSPEELPGVLPELQQQLDTLEDADVQLGQLQQALEAAENEYRQLAEQLSAGRKQAAGRLAEQVSNSMQTLGMEGGRFDVELEPRQDGFSPNGLERV